MKLEYDNSKSLFQNLLEQLSPATMSGLRYVRDHVDESGWYEVENSQRASVYNLQTLRLGDMEFHFVAPRQARGGWTVKPTPLAEQFLEYADAHPEQAR